MIAHLSTTLGEKPMKRQKKKVGGRDKRTDEGGGDTQKNSRLVGKMARGTRRLFFSNGSAWALRSSPEEAGLPQTDGGKIKPGRDNKKDNW